VSAVAAGDREGVYAVQEPAGAEPAKLWGYPVEEVEVLPGAETHPADTPILFFGNLARTCVYGDKQGIRVKLLDQASVYDANNVLVNLAEQDMVALRVHKRVGYVPVLPDGISVLHTGPSS
jgi:HK97 family phage major capsid protein